MAAETAIANGGPGVPHTIGAAAPTVLTREEEPVSDRILRLRRRLLKETPVVSIERAKYYTEHWRSTEESGLAPGIRVALAMKHVYEQMRHQVHPEDHLAGAWTENPIGIPLDIERGLFNRVFTIECDRRSMLWFQAKANLKFFAFMLRRVGPLALYHRLKQLKAFGAAMPSIGLETIDRRKVNPYRIDPADRSRAALNFVVRTHAGSPKALFDAVAVVHARGCSSVSIMNDAVAVEALERRGFGETDARDYAITGCVDMCAPGKTGGEAFSALLLCRVLDTALRNGDSQTLIGTVHDVGPRTGDPDSFTSFDQFVDAFIAQAEHAVEQIVKASRIRDALYADRLPAPLISAFMQGCLERKRDVTHGGALYDLEGILFMNSIANVVDSLHVIRALVFERRRCTFRQLLEAIDHNFVGHEELHREIRAVENRWGNGDPATDGLAREITDRLFGTTYRHRTYKGGPVAPFVNSMTSHTYDGRISIATPDGRRAGTPLAASCNPYNVEKAGPTAVLRSVAALDFRHLLGCAVNIRIHPSAIGRTPETRGKWTGLIRTYFELGGVQLQPSIVSTETLRAAQRDPDRYGDVIVKVGGYSAYFVDLGHEVQNELIARTEHGSA